MTDLAEDNVLDSEEEQTVNDQIDNQDQEVGEETSSEPSAEDIARERGWKSRDEWKGEVPDNFVDDPNEYNRRHEQSNQRLRASLHGCPH